MIASCSTELNQSQEFADVNPDTNQSVDFYADEVNCNLPSENMLFTRMLQNGEYESLLKGLGISDVPAYLEQIDALQLEISENAISDLVSTYVSSGAMSPLYSDFVLQLSGLSEKCTNGLCIIQSLNSIRSSALSSNLSLAEKNALVASINVSLDVANVLYCDQHAINTRNDAPDGLYCTPGGG